MPTINLDKPAMLIEVSRVLRHISAHYRQYCALILSFVFFDFQKMTKAISRLVSFDCPPYGFFRIFDYVVIFLSRTYSRRRKQPYEKLADLKTFSAQPKILFLATQLYDIGGHTKLLLNMISLFSGDTSTCLICTNSHGNASDYAPLTIKKIKNTTCNYFEIDKNLDAIGRITAIQNMILRSRPTTIISFLHMDDSYAFIALDSLRRASNFDFIYLNHADHTFALGTYLADTILTRNKNGRPIAPYLKNRKTIHLPFLLSNDQSQEEFSADAKKMLCCKHMLPADSKISLSSGPKHKFTKNYFTFLKKLLRENVELHHILITNVTENEKESILKEMKEAAERIRILDFTTNFDAYVQISDIFVDSFDQGAALTLVDCMRLQTPIIARKNTKNPVLSFEDYLPPGYKYVATCDEQMLKMCSQLLNDDSAYKEAQKVCFDFFKITYASDKAKNAYKNLILARSECFPSDLGDNIFG